MPATRIRSALVAGQRVFGENRVQEGQEKWPGLRAEFPGIELHLIGPLQTNKVKEAVALFDVIETLDREKLAIDAQTKREEIQARNSPREVKISSEPREVVLKRG
jgi:uncharacterized pyridoxal phosphate-containing UPF0001 family protein